MTKLVACFRAREVMCCEQQSAIGHGATEAGHHAFDLFPILACGGLIQNQHVGVTSQAGGHGPRSR